jgi:hypothetical protein
MLHPANVATPATAAFVVVPVHAKVAPAGVVSVNVTELVLAMIVRPTESWTVTTGWTANGDPPEAVALGWVVNATFVATPVISIDVLTAVVNAPSVAVSE